MKIYPVTMVNVVIIVVQMLYTTVPESEVTDPLGINHLSSIYVASYEQSCTLSAQFPVKVQQQDMYIVVDTTPECGITNTCTTRRAPDLHVNQTHLKVRIV